MIMLYLTTVIGTLNTITLKKCSNHGGRVESPFFQNYQIQTNSLTGPTNVRPSSTRKPFFFFTMDALEYLFIDDVK